MYSHLRCISRNKKNIFKKFIPPILTFGSALFCLCFPLQSSSAARHIHEMADTTNYHVRFDGAAAGDTLTHIALQTVDLDQDGALDLMIESLDSDNNGRSNSGSIYLIYSSLLAQLPTGTGNAIDLANPANWNVRFDGASFQDTLGNGIFVADVGGDSRLDLLFAAPFSRENGLNSGALYVAYSELWRGFTGTGNTIDFADTTNWNIKFEGVLQDILADGAVAAADFDGDGENDLIFPAANEDNNSRIDSGSVYIVSHDFLAAHPGTGQVFNISVGTSYNLRIDGAVANDWLGHGSIESADVNGDEQTDLLIGAFHGDPAGRVDSGYV